jgi:hypothetical protein
MQLPKIKAIMLHEPLGNEGRPGYVVGDNATSIEPCELGLLVKLNHARGFGIGFGDFIVLHGNCKYIEVEPEPEKKAQK